MIQYQWGTIRTKLPLIDDFIWQVEPSNWCLWLADFCLNKSVGKKLLLGVIDGPNVDRYYFFLENECRPTDSMSLPLYFDLNCIEAL